MIILSSIFLLLFIISYSISYKRNTELINRIELLDLTIETDKKIIENLNQSANQYFSALEETKKELAAVAKIEQDKANLFIAEETKKIRAEAILKSKFISKGFSAEHFAPFQMEFNPRDYRHLGDPIDYIVFAGSTEVKDGIIDEITEILFLDIKTGQADLNKGQRRIRDAIVSGKVSFATYNPDTNIFRKYERKND